MTLAGNFLIAAAFLVQTPGLLHIQELIERGDLPSAQAMVDEEIRRAPHDGGLLNLRGIVHARLHQLPAARDDFDAAVRFAPNLTPAWQNLGRACLQLNEAACAEPAWRHVLAAKPGDKEAQLSLLPLYQAQGKWKQAEQVAVQLARQPDFSESEFEELAASWTAARQAPLIAILGEALDRRGAAGPATLQRLAIAYEQLQRMPEARATLEHVAKLEPNNTAHLLELARVAELSHDYEGALGYLAHARDLQPDNPRIHFLFGLIAGELNLPIEAKQSLDKALALDPGSPDYSFAMGSIILKTRDAATASSYFERYATAKPNDSKGRYALGLAYFAGGDYDKAKSQMTVAAADPALAGAAEYYLGRIARLEGDPAEATRRLLKSIALLPRYSESHTELARIALADGEMDKARQELQRALALTPDSFQANQQLLVLYQRTHDSHAEQQAATLKKLDEDRSRQADLMLRTIEVRP